MAQFGRAHRSRFVAMEAVAPAAFIVDIAIAGYPDPIERLLGPRYGEEELER